MISFPLPAGFEPPADAGEGQDFDEVATFSISNGTVTLKALGGNPIDDAADTETEGTPEESAPTEEPEGGGFLSGVEKRMGG